MGKKINKKIKKLISADSALEIAGIIRFNKNKGEKEILSGNREFKDLYRGKRCFIMGNGPSINDIDFNLLRDEIVFTVNQMPRNPKFAQLHSNFHIWSDEKVFNLQKNKAEDMELIEVMKAVNTEDNKPVVFYKYPAYPMIRKLRLDRYLTIRSFDDTPIESKKIKKADLDFTKLVPWFPTVIHYAICLAVYMGFSEIVLLGCDCTGFMTTAKTKMNKAEESLYGYTISENEKKRMEKVQELTSIRDELYCYVLLFDYYKALNVYCKKHGCRLYNATNPTLLESIERVDLMNYL